MYELIKTLPYWLQIALLCIPFLSIIIGVSAFVINVRQTVFGNKLSKVNIVSNSLHTFMDDDLMHEAFYKIEYGKFIYSNDFHGSKEEREIDKLLRHFSNLALMWEDNILSLEDIKPVQYFILRVVNNLEIMKYLAFIETWHKSSNTGSHPYLALNNLAIELKKSSQY